MSTWNILIKWFPLNCNLSIFFLPFSSLPVTEQYWSAGVLLYSSSKTQSTEDRTQLSEESVGGREQGLKVVDYICNHISALYVISSLHAWPSISSSSALWPLNNVSIRCLHYLCECGCASLLPLYQHSWVLFNGIVSVCEVGSLDIQTQVLCRGSLCSPVCVCVCVLMG